VRAERGGGLHRTDPWPPLDEIVEPDDAGHARGQLLGEGRVVHRGEVSQAAVLHHVDGDAEGALHRRDRARRADDEPVRVAVRHGEAARTEVVDERRLLGGRGRVERVELLVREEPAVARRPRIVDVGQEGIEVVPVPEREPDHDTASSRARGPSAVGRPPEEGRDGPGLHHPRRVRCGRAERDHERGHAETAVHDS
jgi:hypothetical protein